MSPRHLQDLLGELFDASDVVLAPAVASGGDPLHGAWRSAQAEAASAYAAWRTSRRGEDYVVYRASAARADAAQDALARRAGRPA